VSEALRKSDIDVELSKVLDAASGNGASETTTSSRRLGVVQRPMGIVTALPTTAEPIQETAPRDAYIGALELRLRELVEIETMRDIEIRNLESEAEQQAARIHTLEVALFHAERRANDLDRRWNALAEVYDAAAAALVVAGGKLEAIHHQTSYRVVLAISGALRRYPALYARLQRSLHRSRAALRR
jgi:hypothetical protein